MLEKPMATITINRAWEMTKAERKQIATWLREQAKGLEKEGNNYATRFKAAFFWNLKRSG